jgi:5'-methylthioadenosine phosphorylase
VSRLAVIGKRHTLGAPPAGARVRATEPLAVLDHDTHVTVYRHGIDGSVAAHRIDHAAHLRALAQLGCDRVLALGSVGSLHPAVGVGTFVAPDDFIALDQRPVAAVDDGDQQVVPGFTRSWRTRILDTWQRVGTEAIVDGGVYWQVNGPRFETPAEIRFLAAYADLVGMTLASECVTANQLGLDYAAVCVVDNLANGVGDSPLTRAAYEQGAAANATRLARMLDAIVPLLAA